MFIEQIIEIELRGLSPLIVHVFLQLAIFMAKQKSLRKFSRESLFTAEILHEAMYLTFPYLGQITYKILPQTARF